MSCYQVLVFVCQPKMVLKIFNPCHCYHLLSGENESRTSANTGKLPQFYSCKLRCSQMQYISYVLIRRDVAKQHALISMHRSIFISGHVKSMVVALTN